LYLLAAGAGGREITASIDVPRRVIEQIVEISGFSSGDNPVDDRKCELSGDNIRQLDRWVLYREAVTKLSPGLPRRCIDRTDSLHAFGDMVYTLNKD
jgi:hypothetical protein